MRDILICRRCDRFVPEFSQGEIFRRRCYCIKDLYHGKMFKVGEYYKLDADESCPYFVEHYLFGLYCKCKESDYGFFSKFKRNRICQYCGREIENRETCPICGFGRFKVWSWMVDLKALAILLCLFAMVVALVLNSKG